MKSKNISSCGNYKLKIYYDKCSGNPFEEWDGLPDVRVYHGRQYKEYAVESPSATIRHALQDNPGIVIRHQKRIADLLEIDFDYFTDAQLSKEDKVTELCNEVTNDLSNKVLYELATILKLPCRLYESRGYSQGDLAQVLIILTDEFFERTGCDRRNSKKIIEDTLKLYDNWAWGDVFAFEAFKKVSYSKTNLSTGETSFYDEWESIGSCGGFYGTDFVSNGMYNCLPDKLKEVAKNFDHDYIDC